MQNPDDLVTIYRATNYAQAYVVRNALEAAGIECQVAEANEPFAGLNVVEPDVMVRARDVEVAEKIISDFERQSAEQADEDEDES